MSDYKCIASQEGICRNVYGFGTKCNGYSKNCKLRQYYENLFNRVRKARTTLKKTYGIVGDSE